MCLTVVKQQRKMNGTDWWKILLSGTALTAVLAFIAKQMEWIRFGKKDEADIRKIESEAAFNLAEANAKKIDDEIKISKAALEWTIQLAHQNEKRQEEIDRLHEVIAKMKADFEKRIDELEEYLQISQNDLNAARRELEILRKQLNGN